MNILERDRFGANVAATEWVVMIATNADNFFVVDLDFKTANSFA